MAAMTQVLACVLKEESKTKPLKRNYWSVFAAWDNWPSALTKLHS